MKNLSNKSKRSCGYIALVLVAICLSSAVYSAGEIREFVAYGQFITATRSAQLNDFINQPGIQVSNAREFERMKNHIVAHYEGVEINNSFVRDDYTMVDCVAINTQPSLRRNDGSYAQIASPPGLLLQENEDREALRNGGDNMLSVGEQDAFGNEKYCRPGFIPLRRLRLEELLQFETLDAFFNKYGERGGSSFPNS